MTYADIVKYFEEKVFERDEVQKEITTYFGKENEKDILDVAIQKARDIDTRFKSGDALNAQADNWEKALKKEGNIGRFIDENRNLGIAQLTKLPDIDRVANRISEVLKEKGANITKEDIDATNLSSIRKLADRIGLSIDETKNVLVKQGYTLKRNETIF